MSYYQKHWCSETNHAFFSFSLLDTLTPSEPLNYKAWDPSSLMSLVSYLEEMCVANLANNKDTVTNDNNNNNNSSSNNVN